MEPMWETASARSDGETAAAAPEEEEAGGGEETVKIFVAVLEQHKNGQLTLAWALRSLPEVAPKAADVVVVVAHVHVPAQTIPVSTYRRRSLPSPLPVRPVRSVHN